jgi:hypothetical protein
MVIKTRGFLREIGGNSMAFESLIEMYRLNPKAVAITESAKVVPLYMKYMKPLPKKGRTVPSKVG